MVLELRGVLRGVLRLLPIAALVVPFGVAFGAAAAQRGLTPLEATLMSAFVFAGASQFAVMDVWAQPLPWLTLALVVLAVNARFTMLGAALAPWLQLLRAPRRLLALVFLTDANFADSRTAFRAGERDAGVLLGGGLTLWAVWVAATALGAVSGAAFGAGERFGVDVVMPAYFAAIVCGELRQELWQTLAPVLVAGIGALLLEGLLPAGWSIIMAALAGGLAGALRHGR